MSEMIERLARALDPFAFSVEVGPDKKGPLTIEDIWFERQFNARRKARIAIEALGEPTEEMIAAAIERTKSIGSWWPKEVWQAMQQAALRPSEPSAPR
jgi:hypothetical protein